MNSIPNIFKFLRITGCGALIMASINFLISGRLDLNSLNAHYLFLGLNLILAILGILSWSKLKEVKTARTFLGLSLAMIPVQMAQLGAFIYSRFNVGNNLQLPSMLTLSLPETTGLSLITIISVLVLLPLAILSFNVLYKSEAKRLSLCFIINSLLLLIPTRDSHHIGIILIFLFLYNVWNLGKLKVLKTFEANLSKTVLFIPLVIMASRNMFYSNTVELLIYVLTIFTFFLFQIALNYLKQELPIKEIISKIEKKYPYQLNNQKKLSNLFESLSPDIAIIELTKAPSLRAKAMWEPLVANYRNYLKILSSL